MDPNTSFARYTDRYTGRVLDLHISGNYTDVRVVRLTEAGSNTEVAVMYCSLRPGSDDFKISAIRVIGHRNAATAHNPSRGVGRLMIFVACQIALELGLTRITLTAMQSAAGFYTRMGMHHAVAAQPALPPPAFQDGRLRADWCRDFNTMLSFTRTGGRMVSSIGAVLHNILYEVSAQWMQVDGTSADTSNMPDAVAARRSHRSLPSRLWRGIRRVFR